MSQKEIKVALVHDFLTAYGGAERVLEVMAEMYPEAPIYTLLYAPERMHGKFKGKIIRTSFLQKFPGFLRKRYKWLLPLFPVAPETFDLRDYDLVISSSGAWSKGIITRLNTVHIAYLHSPMRFVWDNNEEYLKQQGRCFVINYFTRRILNRIRIWDKVAADRPDHIISNSRYTQKRVQKYYGRESVMVYPPVSASRGRTSGMPEVRPLEASRERYFLVVSRLSPYKKIDKIVEAFNRLKLPLIVVGEGAQKKYLQKIAKNNVKILGWQSDEKIEKLYENARAFVFAAVDDFGIAPVEAMAHGVPVIAIGEGGTKETMIEGETGEFFEKATVGEIIKAVEKFVENEDKYDGDVIRARAGEFGRERFVREIGKFIEKVV